MAVQGSNIPGLREQIIANAARIYFEQVKYHLDRTESKIIKPSEIFDVVISKDGSGPSANYRAALVLLDPDDPGVQLKASGRNIEDAYSALLDYLAELTVSHV